MALVIEQARVVFPAWPLGATTAEVHYRVSDETTPDLHRSGILTVTLPDSTCAQLASIVEDALHAAGKL